ncbi:MAG: polysaccharide deacetylase family protein [Elusimicrobia bacterium]|nr:polysaccharide deacetylase family protein [Elusimicrobiota bacterium]
MKPLRLLIGSLVAVLVLSSAFAALKPGDFVTSGPTGAKRIALTFDDGPGPYTEKVMALLDKYNVKATFFMLGEEVQYRGKLAKEVLSRGHEIGSHTFDHKNYLQVYRGIEKKLGGKPAAAQAAEQAKAQLAGEMKKSRQIIEGATGIHLEMLRMPHGVDRPWVKQAAKESGFVLVNWTYGADWLNKSEAELEPGYLKAIKPGAILLLHDGGSHRDKTLVITEAVLKAAKEKGYEVVPLSALIGLDKKS